MNKIRESEFEISGIEKQIDDKIQDFEHIIFNYSDMKAIAAFAIAKTIEMIDSKLDEYLTLDEAANTFEILLDLTNNDKYKPLIKLLQKIGGD